jgi:hypothetical protein
MVRRLVRVCATVAVLLAGGGCYQHVVGAKGYGASGTDVYEPSVKDSPAARSKTPLQRPPPSRFNPPGS